MEKLLRFPYQKPCEWCLHLRNGWSEKGLRCIASGSSTLQPEE